MTAVMSFALCFAVVAQTQGNSQSNPGSNGQMQQPTASTSQGQSSGNQNMSGKVSSDAKSFTNDDNSQKYQVANPDALQGHEGQHVALIVHVDPDSNAIHIMRVEAPPQQ
jgi:hypothetical protein